VVQQYRKGEELRMAAVAMSRPTIRKADQVERRWFYGGGVQSWLATAEDTGGTFLLFSDEMERGKVTPLHTHPVDETLYVTDGVILAHVDGTEYEVGAGGLLIAPRGLPHAFQVVSATATLLTLHVPGTCQDFFFGASEPLTATTQRVVDFQRIQASAEAHGGIDIIGPPPFGPR
jgi:quercetin dioxygenase-like cupin family protein